MALRLLLGVLTSLILACGPVVEPPMAFPPPPMIVPPVPDIVPTDVDDQPQSPQLTLLLPAPGTLLSDGVDLAVLAQVTDDLDAPETLNVAWVSDVAGVLDTTPPSASGVIAATLVGLPIEPQTLTLVVTDSGGHLADASVSLGVNSPPDAVSVYIEPVAPSSMDTLVAAASGALSDPDRGPEAIALHYSWLRNDGETEVSGPVVGPDVTTAGDIWRVEVRPYDGFVYGPTAEAETLIGLAPPVVAIDAPDGAAGAVTCVYVEVGSAAEAGGVAWWWQIDDGDAFVAQQALAPAQAADCQRVRCRVDLALGEQLESSNTAELVLPFGAACDDGNICTVDQCAGTGGCQHDDNVAPCEDGDPCTVEDVCADGLCESGEPMTCYPGPNASAVCVEGSCEITCDAGWGECDQDEATGCEVPIDTVENCGFCGVACALDHAATVVCEGAACLVETCEEGWENCDGLDETGCEAEIDPAEGCEP